MELRDQNTVKEQWRLIIAEIILDFEMNIFVAPLVTLSEEFPIVPLMVHMSKGVLEEAR